ncbi:hypothetical protein WR25_26564 [Diploscapter pachys]|uniref:Uncharacterized protein n=1 Tax=Diploscapter pachys TaxID=2018661 RepID=A0A2A2LSM2_9BILA|nr:hypothetical protein WR25_26564 [Diploscapter pachys]
MQLLYSFFAFLLVLIISVRAQDQFPQAYAVYPSELLWKRDWRSEGPSAPFRGLRGKRVPYQSLKGLRGKRVFED